MFLSKHCLNIASLRIGKHRRCVAFLRHVSSSCAFLDNTYCYNVEVCSHCGQWLGFSPLRFKLHFFRLAPWLSWVFAMCALSVSNKTLWKNNNPTQYSTGGDLGRIYPEEEDDLTSLGGPQRHLNFGKNCGGEIFQSYVLSFNCILCFRAVSF